MVTNGIITAPVSIADVESVIGTANHDLGTLCTLSGRTSSSIGFLAKVENNPTAVASIFYVHPTYTINSSVYSTSNLSGSHIGKITNIDNDGTITFTSSSSTFVGIKRTLYFGSLGSMSVPIMFMTNINQYSRIKPFRTKANQIYISRNDPEWELYNYGLFFPGYYSNNYSYSSKAYNLIAANNNHSFKHMLFPRYRFNDPKRLTDFAGYDSVNTSSFNFKNEGNSNITLTEYYDGDRGGNPISGTTVDMSNLNVIIPISINSHYGDKDSNLLSLRTFENNSYRPMKVVPSIVNDDLTQVTTNGFNHAPLEIGGVICVRQGTTSKGFFTSIVSYAENNRWEIRIGDVSNFSKSTITWFFSLGVDAGSVDGPIMFPIHSKIEGEIRFNRETLYSQGNITVGSVWYLFNGNRTKNMQYYYETELVDEVYANFPSYIENANNHSVFSDTGAVLGMFIYDSQGVLYCSIDYYLSGGSFTRYRILGSGSGGKSIGGTRNFIAGNIYIKPHRYAANGGIFYVSLIPVIIVCNSDGSEPSSFDSNNFIPCIESTGAANTYYTCIVKFTLGTVTQQVKDDGALFPFKWDSELSVSSGNNINVTVSQNKNLVMPSSINLNSGCYYPFAYAGTGLTSSTIKNDNGNILKFRMYSNKTNTTTVTLNDLINSNSWSYTFLAADAEQICRDFRIEN